MFDTELAWPANALMPGGKGTLNPIRKLNKTTFTKPDRRTRLRRGAPERSMRLLLRQMVELMLG